jgi:hypothetical protein
LDEIGELKKNTQLNVLSAAESNQLGNKLYSYENRLHHVIMKGQQLTHNSPTTPPLETDTYATQINDLINSGNSSRYSSHATLNNVLNEQKLAAANLSQQKVC